MFFQKKMYKGILYNELFFIIFVLFEWALFVWKVYSICYQINAISAHVSELAGSIQFFFYQFWWTVG